MVTMLIKRYTYQDTYNFTKCNDPLSTISYNRRENEAQQSFTKKNIAKHRSPADLNPKTVNPKPKALNPKGFFF